jgi:membrane protease subunit (stomatin/prohibitin family)
LQDQNIEILKSAASNPGVAGGILGVGVGMNIGATIAPTMLDISSNVFSRHSTNEPPNDQIQKNIGSNQNQKLSAERIIELLRHLGELRAAGILTEEEFKSEKKRILAT